MVFARDEHDVSSADVHANGPVTTHDIQTIANVGSEALKYALGLSRDKIYFIEAVREFMKACTRDELY